MIKNMSEKEQDKILYLVQGAKIGETIGALNKENNKSTMRIREDVSELENDLKKLQEE